MRSAIILLVACTGAQAQIFVGLEGSAPPVKTSDLEGFPDVGWASFDGFDVSGAAGRGDGSVYLCNGPFTTVLYEATPGNDPNELSTLTVDIHALASDGDTLWGYSNFASPKGIYEINPNTGVCTLALDVYTEEGFRFFALDYNGADGLLYGYTEYGDTGLYSIDLDSGVMKKIVEPIPAANSQGRAMAIGNNTVYLLATRGDDGIPAYAYDLSQGQGGTWTPFTQPYPAYHSTGGAAWLGEIGGCAADFNGDGSLDILDFVAFQGAFVKGDDSADCDGNGELNILDFVCFQGLFAAGC